VSFNIFDIVDNTEALDNSKLVLIQNEDANENNRLNKEPENNAEFEINEENNSDISQTDISDTFSSDSENDEVIVELENDNDELDDFIYENATLKISQFNFLMTLFISRFSLSKKCSKDLLKLICFLLPQPHKIKKNIEKLYRYHDIKKTLKEIVCSSCWTPKINVNSHCENKDCSFNNCSNVNESGLEVFYLDTTLQLEAILKREGANILKYKNVK